MSESTYTVLILDDDEVVRESFLCYFEDHGWQVWSAASAEEALEVVAREKPGCAVVDIRLPGADGNAFIRDVNGTYPSMACVICTGSPEFMPPTDSTGFVSCQDCSC